MKRLITYWRRISDWARPILLMCLGGFLLVLGIITFEGYTILAGFICMALGILNLLITRRKGREEKL